MSNYDAAVQIEDDQYDDEYDALSAWAESLDVGEDGHCYCPDCVNERDAAMAGELDE